MKLEYIGDSGRVFPTLGIKPDVGEVYEVPFEADNVLWRDPNVVDRVSAADDKPGLVSEPVDQPGLVSEPVDQPSINDHADDDESAV